MQTANMAYSRDHVNKMKTNVIETVFYGVDTVFVSLTQ